MTAWSQHLARLYEKHRTKLESLVARATGDRDAAADIVQDVFARLMISGQQKNAEENVKILYASTRNATIDHVRMRNRRRDILERMLPEQLARDPLAPDAILEGKQELLSLDDALMQLGRTTRDIFILRRVHAMSNADIARRYGISVSSVEKHVARAMRFCQERFSDQIE